MTLPFTLLFPRNYLAAKPQLAATLAEIDDGPGHRWVSTLVPGHSVPLSESEQLSYTLRVNDVFSIDEPSHAPSLQRLASHPGPSLLKGFAKYY